MRTFQTAVMSLPTFHILSIFLFHALETQSLRRNLLQDEASMMQEEILLRQQQRPVVLHIDNADAWTFRMIAAQPEAYMTIADRLPEALRISPLWRIGGGLDPRASPHGPLACQHRGHGHCVGDTP